MPRSRYEDLDRQVDRVARHTLDVLADAGAHLVEVDVDDDLALGGGPGIELVLFEAALLLRARLAAAGSPAAGAPLADVAAGVASPDVRALVELMASTSVTAERYEQARAARWRLRRILLQVLDRVDVLIGPTCPVLPPLIGEDETIVHNGRTAPVFATVTRNTSPGTVTGLPMLSLPAGSAGGLPVGMCLEGRPFADVDLLRIGAAVEPLIRPASAGTRD